MEYIIYLVEDDTKLNLLLTAYLKKEGWQVHSFSCGEEAIKQIPKQPHLWIIDILLPAINGYELVQRIKLEYPLASIIIISSKNSDIEKIVGLEIGADDYMPKPFMAEELVIRTRKLLARVYPILKENALSPLPQTFLLPPYTVDLKKRSVSNGQYPVELTTKEFDLLQLFALHNNKILSREQILEQVWDIDYAGTNHLVDDLVYRLRKKMPQLQLETQYGYGYRLVDAIK